MFTPDQRNVGGRNMILQGMYNHRQQLNEILSSPVAIKKTYSSSPRQRKPFIMPEKDIHYHDRKAVIDTSPPISYNILDKRMNKTQKFLLQEHQQNLLIQRKKIEAQKKKSHLDYLLYPTFLFRRKTVSDKTLFTPPSYSPPTRARPRKDQSLHDSYRKQTKLFPFSTVSIKPLKQVKAYEISLQLDDQDNFQDISWDQIEQKLSVKEPLSLKNLKHMIKQIIQQYGIYSAQEYEKLIKLVLKYTPEKRIVYELFNEIIGDLQMELSQQ